jgi:hypothetical protein
LRQVLDNAELGQAFREYAAARHANEGIMFLDDLMASGPTAQGVMDTYFVDGAPRWVNLSDKVGKELADRFASGRYADMHGLFHAAQSEVFVDIKSGDTFRNFCLENKSARLLSKDSDTLLLDQVVVPENFRELATVVLRDTALVNMVRFYRFYIMSYHAIRCISSNNNKSVGNRCSN